MTKIRKTLTKSASRKITRAAMAIRCAIAGCAIAFVMLAIPTHAAEQQLPSSRTQIQLTFAPLVRKVAPAVVNIYTRKIVRTRQLAPLFNDPFFRRFFGNKFGYNDAPAKKRVQNSLGSGVIVGADGVIVTNFHVIEGADEITVVLSDRREFDATIIGADERTDLAVLRVDNGGAPFPVLALRDSDELEVGDLVLAIGNPFGVGQTVTSGIVSAVARTQAGISNLNFFIQTDAAINPGNSGGALVSMDGKLVGINSAIFSRSGGSLGIGFAIPANMVRSVITGVAGGGRLVRPWLGAWGQTVTAEIAESLGMPKPGGVLLEGMYHRGPADRGGLKVGDVILKINNHEVYNPAALRFRIATLVIGEEAQLTILRKGREKTRAIKLVAPPEDPPRDHTALSGQQPISGASVANLSPALADELGLDAFKSGVIVLDIRQRTPARRFGFRAGDRIKMVNGEKIASVKQLVKLLNQPTDQWRIVINRGGKTLNLAIDK